MEKSKLEHENELIKKTSNKISTNKMNAMMYSPSQLAYIGDSVYELLVRSHIIQNYDTNVNKMHRLTVKFVKAHAQASLVNLLLKHLNEDEKRIVKRGRNAKVTSSPKNAELMDYRYATGFEALFGYLYLNNELDRLFELFNKVIEIYDEKDKSDESEKSVKEE